MGNGRIPLHGRYVSENLRQWEVLAPPRVTVGHFLLLPAAGWNWMWTWAA
ncbi:MAG: hypothetical protein ACLR0U_18620 [Enterocloster clostridioformis]